MPHSLVAFYGVSYEYGNGFSVFFHSFGYGYGYGYGCEGYGNDTDEDGAGQSGDAEEDVFTPTLLELIAYAHVYHS